MSNHGSWRGVGAVLCTAVVTAAQQDAFEELALRVSSLRPDGSLIIDRGRRDLVAVGDRVVLTPRNGSTVQGRVVELDDRTALIEVVDRYAVLPIGTKGHVLLPKGRRVPKPVEGPAVVPPADPAQPAEEEWRPGMPLLGHTRPPHPNERPSAITGRIYSIANVVRTLGSWSQSYLRAGIDTEVTNVRGDGGVLRINGEFDWSTEASNNSGPDLRLFELSYEHGGTRFEPLRWQVGRFLQRDMPEFGILDGAEVGYRREGGDRFGASFGYLPELDDDLNTFSDLQFAAWYLWNSDVAERLSWGIGYQKSWHHLDADRDLVVLKARYLPIDGWDVSSSLWLDFYGSGDNQKGKTFEVSRANAFLSRRWKGSGGLEFAYDHESYPELLRHELPQTIQPQTLLDAHQDRLSMHAYWQRDESTRWFTRLTGWIDEEHEGGSGEFGIEWDGALQKGARTGFAVFEVQAPNKNVLGLRVEHGGTFDFGRLDLLYELGFVHHESFPSDRNDLLQHRLGALLTTDLGSNWDGTFFADGTLYDSELSLGLGIYLQRHF